MGSSGNRLWRKAERALAAVGRWAAEWVPKLLAVGFLPYLVFRLVGSDTIDPATAGTVLALAVATLVVLAVKADDVRRLVARVEKFALGAEATR